MTRGFIELIASLWILGGIFIVAWNFLHVRHELEDMEREAKKRQQELLDAIRSNR